MNLSVQDAVLLGYVVGSGMASILWGMLSLLLWFHRRARGTRR